VHPLEPLVRPRSVAIVGASADRRKTAGKPAAYLKKHGYAGRLYLVNPRYSEIDGVACFPSVADLPEAPDVALVLLGADSAADAVARLAQLGVHAAIVLAGGFAEIDAAGAERQAALVEAARGGSPRPLAPNAQPELDATAPRPPRANTMRSSGPNTMRLLGPNTIGIVNVVDNTALSASGALELDSLLPGSVAVVSQSGGMLGALLSRGTAHGLGFSRLISTGNEADIDVCDAIEYLLQDAETRVIALYLESVRRPLRFRELARQAATCEKRLVVYKVGRSEAGAESATSHTGALAGTDRVYDALFRQMGVVRVDALDGLVDVSVGLARGKRLYGSRLGILTSTGGGGSLVADACGVRGFVAPPPDPPTADRLRAALVGEAAMAERNPIDLTLANLRGSTYRDTIGALVDSPSYDGVVVVVGSSGLEDPSLAAAPVREAEAGTEKPVVVYVNPHAMNIVSYLNSVGVPAFSTAEGCAAALAALRVGEGVARQPTSPHAQPAGDQAETRAVSSPGGRAADHAETQALPSPVRHEGDQGQTQAVSSTVRRGGASVERGALSSPARRGGGRSLNEAEALALFAELGIRVARHAVAHSPEEAVGAAESLGLERVVVKMLSRAMTHKSDVGGVKLDVPLAEVAATCRQMGQHAEGWLIQEQIHAGTEMLLGLIRDAQLGPALVLGAGGTATEVFGDASLRLLPLQHDDPREMLDELRCRVLLEGFRGQPPGDVDALFESMRRFAGLGERVQEAEINPLFVLPRGQGVVAADGLVILNEP
jgi:acyl-CoA synthetase (NDP forming)